MRGDGASWLGGEAETARFWGRPAAKQKLSSASRPKISVPTGGLLQGVSRPSPRIPPDPLCQKAGAWASQAATRALPVLNHYSRIALLQGNCLTASALTVLTCPTKAMSLGERPNLAARTGKRSPHDFCGPTAWRAERTFALAPQTNHSRLDSSSVRTPTLPPPIFPRALDTC